MSLHAWIISPGTYVDIDLADFGIDAAPKHVTEYHLSDIGRYLLFPGPFEVESRLIGCACDDKPSARHRFRQSLARRNPFKRKNPAPPDTPASRLLLARLAVDIPPLQDAHLARHIDRLRVMLRPHDPIVQDIRRLNLDRLADIRGVCEDAAGHRTHIRLNGDLETKRRYVLDNLLAPVPITLPQARIDRGLYEMRGLAARGYQASRRHRLLRFHVNGQFFACLLNTAGRVAFWIEDAERLHELVLLQQAMETNPVLKASMESCLEGEGQALRLMINPALAIDYSGNRLPRVYQDLFREMRLNGTDRKTVVRSLKLRQTGVSFSFARREGHGDPRPTTSLSVMHDVKALEPVREHLPDLYAAINRRATLSEAGKYYLLESIKGRPDEERL